MGADSSSPRVEPLEVSQELAPGAAYARAQGAWRQSENVGDFLVAEPSTSEKENDRPQLVAQLVHEDFAQATKIVTMAGRRSDLAEVA